MRFFLSFYSLILSAPSISGQSPVPAVYTADSLFWMAYNRCDIQQMKIYFSDDIEFYHDKGGVTLGADALEESFVKGICRNHDSFSLRRDIVPHTVTVYALHKNDSLYGAIIAGEHMFYITKNGEKEFASGHAKFANLWLVDSGTWKMKRVFSFDHQPIPQHVEKPTVIVPRAILKEYDGRYQSRKSGLMKVQSVKGHLLIHSGNAAFEAYPSSSTTFFVKEKDLTFQFSKKAAAIMDVIVKENGAIVDTFSAARR